MPNDLTTQRNLLNSRPESRPESRSESQRQKLASSGFTASIWTLSGVVLVACSNVEDFLGIDDGGGGGGRSVHVQNSPVQGARLYFDADGDGTVSMEERAAQDAQHPQGFVTNENGEATGIPGDLYGKAFVAVLDGAFDADTGTEFPANTEYQSIPNAAGDHLLASPITDYVANQLAENLMPEEVDPAIRAEVAELLGLDPADTTNADQIRMAVNALLDDVSDHTRYDGSSGVDALARYLADPQNANPTTAEVVAEVDRVLGDNPAEALTVTSPTLPPVMIGEHDTYIATIEAESLVHAVSYRIVTSPGSDAFTVNNGVIMVADSTRLSPGTMTLNVMVTNSDGASEMVSVEITVATAPELTAPTDTTGMVVENVVGDGTALISGIMPATGTTVTATDFVIRAPGGLSDKFVVVAGTGDTFDLALATGESLDYEAFSDSNGEFNVEVWAVEGGVRSNALTLTVTVEDANDAPVFLNNALDRTLNFEAEIAENTATGTEIARVGALDRDGDSVTYAITGGNTNSDFAINADSGAITIANQLDFETTESYTLTVTATGLDANGDPDATTPDTATVTINVMDLNDETPTYTESGDASARITDPAGNPSTDNISTGYSITIADADANNTFSVSVSGDSRDRFEFVRQPNSDVWDLVLKAGEVIDEAEGATIALTYTVSDGDNTAATTTAQPGSVSIGVVDSPIKLADADGNPVSSYTASIDEPGANAVLPQIMASVDDAPTGHTFTYAEARDDSGLFLIDSGTGEINLDGPVNYETATSHELTVRVTYDADGDTTDTSDQETRDVQVVINVNNVHETGTRSYEVMQSTTDLEDGTVLTAQRVANSDEDPDGVAPGSIRYQWSADGTEITGATGATYMISGTPAGLYTVEVSYLDGYNAGLDPADQMRTTVEASTSSVSWDVVPSYDPVANPLTDGEAPMANDPVIPMTAISASGGDGKIEYSIEDPSGVFQIHPNSGALSVSENGPAVWDFETNPSYEIYIIATDVDDGSTMGTGDTARIPVTINITDANEAPVVNDALQVNTASGAIDPGSQENLLVRGDDITAMLGSGITPITGATTGDDSALDGTAADEYIYGDAGDDTITGGGGTDHIIGGAGDDGITLASGSVETIYYRFSTTGFAPIASDGADTVTGFRRGEDRIVLLDTDSTTPFDRDTLLSDAQNAVIGSSTFSANPLFDVAITEATVKLTGFQIVFDDTFFTINYATDSEVTVRSGGNWLAAAVPYLGALDNMGVPEDFASGAGLRDNSLLLNYFMPSADVLISEKRNAADGAFATLSATDPDADTSPNGQIASYTISGTGMGLFTINSDGEISVASTATLDYDTASEYTLEITATDGGGEVSDPTTITIGILEDSDSVYSVSRTGDVLTATLDTADSFGVDMDSISYQWYTTTDGTTKTPITGITDTTSKTLNIAGHMLPDDATYGVTVTYDDNAGNMGETVDAIFVRLISGTSNADTDLAGTVNPEYIYGDAGNDEIDGGGGNDHILGGTGNDEITLSSASGSVETIYYRISSAGSAAWTGSDGADTIENFRRDEDRLVFIDTDGTPLTLTEFLSNDNLGSAGGKLSVKPIQNAVTLTGLEILFGGTKALTINYHSDSRVIVFDNDAGDYTTASQDYFGAIQGGAPSQRDSTTQLLTEHATLVPNYFGSGTHDNLQVVDDDMVAILDLI